MRRKDREMDRSFGLELIDRSEYGTISMVDGEGRPYGLPISLARKEDILYFHSAREGRKVDIFKEHPMVSISFVGRVRVPDLYSKDELKSISKDESKAKLLISNVFTTEFESVLVTGRVESIEEESKKVEAMKYICEKYTPDKMEYFDRAIKASLDRTNVYRVQIDKIKSKRKKYDQDGREMKSNL